MSEAKRCVIQARLLGLDKNATKRGRENEYAIDVVLSDESQYTMFRSLKEIVAFHTKLMNKFKVEAGYFKKEERVIPECPIKQTIFGPQRAIRDDKSFGRLLNFYIKEIPALPAALVKSDLVTEFFSLRASDLDAPGEEKPAEKKRNRSKVKLTDDSLISGPLSLKSYTTVADFTDKKTKFSFKEGTTVQLIQKDPGGWWMVDAQGLIGWAPASYLMPVEETDLKEEAEENENLIEQERVGTRYISISAYQASRDDELSFVRGAVVKVLKKFVDGWWLVRYNGGEGFVPGAMFRKFDRRQATLYVKKIKRNFTSRGTTRIVPTVKPQWMNSRYNAPRPGQRNVASERRPAPDTLQLPGSKPAAAAAAAAERLHKKEDTSNNVDNTPVAPVDETPMYIAQEGYEGNGIHIKENEQVPVMDSSDKEWWYVRDSKGIEGWAPASYFKPVEDYRRAFSAPVNQQEQRNSSSYTFNNDSEYMSEDEIFDDLCADDAADSVELENCYVVVKDYAKQAVDELDVFEGQVVCVIDDSDEDVWYVNADGQEGWVPSNILKIIMDEFDSSRESTPCGGISADASADSELSDDDGGGRRLKRRGLVRKSEKGGDLKPTPRPRSAVLSGRSPSPSLAAQDSSQSSPRPQRARLHLSDGSDSDAVANVAHMDTDVTILIGNKTIEELQWEADEANRIAMEAKLRAQALTETLALAKQRKHFS